MDNRPIAAFIETNRTRMNSVIICLRSKDAGQRMASTWLGSSCDLSKTLEGG